MVLIPTTKAFPRRLLLIFLNAGLFDIYLYFALLKYILNNNCTGQLQWFFYWHYFAQQAKQITFKNGFQNNSASIKILQADIAFYNINFFNYNHIDYRSVHFQIQYQAASLHDEYSASQFCLLVFMSIQCKPSNCAVKMRIVGEQDCKFHLLSNWRQTISSVLDAWQFPWLYRMRKLRYIGHHGLKTLQTCCKRSIFHHVYLLSGAL